MKRSPNYRTRKPGSADSGPAADFYAEAVAAACAVLRPAPRLSLSEWADAHRELSKESSAEPGRFRTDRIPYLRGIQDAITDPRIHTVVCQKPAQFGWSTVIENAIGYHMDLDPCPMLLIEPRDRDCQKFSKKRLGPMLRDTPVLRDKVPAAKSRDPGNTIDEKIFPGGSLTLVGANSPAGLSGDSVRIVYLDEVDRYSESAGSEGDPVDLGKQRTEAFWNRKHVMGSTPGNKETSRIEPAYLESDRRLFFVPCPDCGHEQALQWEGVRWKKRLEDGTEVLEVPRGYDGAYQELPKTAAYFCSSCGAGWSDAKRFAALRWGKWKATAPFTGTAGFHGNRLMSDRRTLTEIVESFLLVRPFPERLKVWINTTLGQTWEDRGSKVEDAALLARCEPYGPEVPEQVVVVTAGVDLQDDRLEVDLVGWGRGEENWSLPYTVIRGDPSTALPWRDLDVLLGRELERADGVKLRVAAACIDTGGHHTQAAYAFCKTRYARRVWAVKGASGGGRTIWPAKASKKNVGRTNLFLIGVDAAKERLYARLKIEDPGPGYCHFPDDRSEEYFRQLTAERLVTTYHRGFARRSWVKTRPRNEALDGRVYAIAAFEGLVAGGLDLDVEADRLEARARAIRAGQPLPARRGRRMRSTGVQR